MPRYEGREKMFFMKGVSTSEGAGIDNGAYFDEEALGAPAVLAFNEGGYNCVAINLRELISWLRANRPEILLDTSRVNG